MRRKEKGPEEKSLKAGEGEFSPCAYEGNGIRSVVTRVTSNYLSADGSAAENAERENRAIDGFTGREHKIGGCENIRRRVSPGGTNSRQKGKKALRMKKFTSGKWRGGD